MKRRRKLRCRRGEDAPPARILVFADDEEVAAALAEPLRNALWGAHKIAVLLPHGQEPIKVPLGLAHPPRVVQ